VILFYKRSPWGVNVQKRNIKNEENKWISAMFHFPGANKIRLKEYVNSMFNPIIQAICLQKFFQTQIYIIGKVNISTYPLLSL